MHFERFVSLGSYCLPKFQIDRYIAYRFLGLKENSTLLADGYIKQLPKANFNAINGGNHLFDWVVVENYEKLIDLLNGGLEYRLTPESLEARKNDQGRIVNMACPIAGVVWHHLFKTEDGFVTDGWVNEIGDLAGKVEHLRKKFLGLAEYRTLYIANISSRQVHDGFAARLADALEKLRQNDHFALLIAVADQDFELPNDTYRIYYRRFDPTPDFPQYPWLGNAASWDQLFSTFELVPRKINGGDTGIAAANPEKSGKQGLLGSMKGGLRKLAESFPKFKL